MTVYDIRFRLAGIGKLLTPQILVYSQYTQTSVKIWHDAVPEDLIEIARYIERKQA